jgi:shikimate 5-dehydrogenase
MTTPSGSTELLALFGRDLSRSPSPRTHTRWAMECQLNLVYLPLSCSSEVDFIHLATGLMRSPNFRGGNITNPYKRTALNIPNLRIAATAELCKAGNTLHRISGEWWLSNTDLKGCIESLNSLITRPSDDFSVVLMGGGAMTQTVQAALAAICQERKIKPRQVTQLLRTDFEHKAFAPLGQTNEPLIIINTLPVGTQDAADAASADLFSWLQDRRPSAPTALFDMSYTETSSCQKARAFGWTIETGQRLFEVQARESFKLWTQQLAPNVAVFE